MCVGEQAPKSSKYDFSKIYIQNYKNQKFLGRVRWVRWVRQLVEAFIYYYFFVTSCLPGIFFFASSPFLNGIDWDPNFILKRYRNKFSRGKFA